MVVERDANRAWNRTGETLYDAFEMKMESFKLKISIKIRYLMDY